MEVKFLEHILRQIGGVDQIGFKGTNFDMQDFQDHLYGQMILG